MKKRVIAFAVLLIFISCKSVDGECFIVYEKRQIEENYFFLWEREMEWNNETDNFQVSVNQLKVPYDVYTRFDVGDEFCRD